MAGSDFAGYVGRRTLGALRYYSDLLALFIRICNLLIEDRREGSLLVRRGVVEQIHSTAVQALPLVIPAAMLVGAGVFSQFTAISGQYDFGKLVSILLIREAGPFLTAIFVLLRTATAVTVEMGYMTVQGEMEALEMAGIDPIRLVCIPRLFGITMAMVCLIFVFDFVAVFGGYALNSGTSVSSSHQFFLSLGRAVSGTDVIISLLKSLCFGIAISLICLYRGLKSRKSMPRVALNTSRAAVDCFIAILLLNVLISGVFYV